MSTTTQFNELQLKAISGDLLHKQDVYCASHSVSDPGALQLLSNAAQASWLRSHYPELVPSPNPNGTAPSDHTVATRFEIEYTLLSDFRRHCLRWLYRTISFY